MNDTGPRYQLGDQVVHRSHGATVIGRTFSANPTYDLMVNGVVVARVPEPELRPVNEEKVDA